MPPGLTTAQSCKPVSPDWLRAIICPLSHPVEQPQPSFKSGRRWLTSIIVCMPQQSQSPPPAALFPQSCVDHCGQTTSSGMLAGTAGVERKRCLPLLRGSPGPPLTPLPHLLWWNQSVPSPIHWALSHSSINTRSLSPPSLYSVSLLPPFWTPSHSLLHSEHPTLPPTSPSLPYSAACLVHLLHSPLVVHFFFSIVAPFISLFPASISLPTCLLTLFSSFPGSVPGGFATHFKSLHCLDMPAYSTSSLPTLLSHAQYPWVLWIFLSSTRASSCGTVFTRTLAPYLWAPANIVSKWLLGWWFMHAVTHHALLL